MNLFTIGITFGNLVVYLAGWILPWKMAACGCLGISVVSQIFTFAIPETPHFLMTKGRHFQALEVLQKLRGSRAKAEEEVQEISKAKERTEERFNTRRPAWLEPSSLKRLGVMCVLNALSVSTGISLLFVFSINVLEESGTSVDPYSASVAVAAVRLAAACLASYVHARIGRITLLGSMSILMALGYFGMAGSSHYLKQAKITPSLSMNESAIQALDTTEDDHDSASKLLSYVPVLCMVCILVFNALGFFPVVRALSVEVFPTELRSLASAISFTATGLVLCGVALVFPALMAAVGFEGAFALFGLAALATGAWGRAMVPETRGRTLQDIQAGGKTKKRGKPQNGEEGEDTRGGEEARA